MPIVLKSGSLSFLEASEPVQACNGIPLPLPLHNRLCAELHFNICKKAMLKLDIEHWYEHVPKSVETSREVNTLRTGDADLRF